MHINNNIKLHILFCVYVYICTHIDTICPYCWLPMQFFNVLSTGDAEPVTKNGHEDEGAALRQFRMMLGNVKGPFFQSVMERSVCLRLEA